jgi:hypothetical protein
MNYQEQILQNNILIANYFLIKYEPQQPNTPDTWYWYNPPVFLFNSNYIICSAESLKFNCSWD